MNKMITNRKQKKRNKHLDKHDYYCTVQYKFELDLGFSCDFIGAGKT